jgi:uncharacterized protein (TIGR03382 family)
VPGAQGAQEGAQKGAQKKDGVGPAAAVLVLPGAVWLWWRRRRTHETETPAG